ncbi:MAG TPA: GNAT family N-acetyltransferase [Gemmatales bacterium]|nr:GNAT family N-acetyltransferase [Gemmatales bacterium]
MIRPTVPHDTPFLLAIAERTQVFKAHELQALREVLDDFHDEPGLHQAHTFESNGIIIGFVYFAPAAMTDRTWYLYWIFVDKHTQAKGVGSHLLGFAEAQAREAGGRLMLIETSGLPYYQLTRAFYLKHGYDLDATIRDYYEDGDDMNVFRKRL